ncbi:hypothetical protein LTR59_006765 [Friedmanniomyces endolithicus]|nr:hypothetical protein LTR94_001794 [Friedmanniomyces endolithicus]KAK0797560.1 hypothetical protein LTR59_006765 [Friedmanniomyces endolithicus]KAK0817145.1 hypothetical protein LTR38_001781 [Friedmanniomyces endolithicus]KAK0819940.1 hypothetical protein LTR75_001968 [Friedmanniomyces endolithicus]KAK0852866.1 hypothetical protein LTR03_003300 [Friedmanniomyces endolithicus]
MARTKQTAAMSAGSRARRQQRLFGNGAVPEAQVDDSEIEIDDETKARHKEIEEGEMRAELKFLDKKHTDKGQSYYADTIDEDVPEQVNWWSKFALCLVRHMDQTNTYVQNVCLQVNSPHLKDILHDTIGHYPGISFHTKDISIPRPYHVLYHYRHELEKAGEDLEEGSEACGHNDLLLDWINTQFKETIDETENLLEQGMMTYPHLWTIFRPDATIYAPVFGQARAFTLCSYEYACGDNPGLYLQLSFVDFDGEDFGTRSTGRLVAAFSGAERISELSGFPIKWHSEAEEVKIKLIQRGRRWEQHAGMHFCTYKGVALEYTPCGISRYNTDGRVVVDTKTSHRLNANNSFNVSAFKSSEDKLSKRRKIRSEDYDGDANAETLDLVPEEKLELDPLTDEQCLLANAMVRGFSFAEKRWFDFFVDRLGPANWDSGCFDKLVLPAAQKDLVRALVTTHTQHSVGFDDIVKGKGKGLILVLHGPPGVGKTCTAETVAEYCERPLYMVSSGDLGTNASQLDSTLSRILDMASTWKAVLLIDEADVFLERRSLHDMERNSLVSIFLRVLEYYEGILFLTSNRVNTFDDAFKSRIHVPLKYNDLTAESRKQIWQNFLAKTEGGVQLIEGEYDGLAQANINGRQIKNVIRTAKSLAQFHGEKLDRAKLEQVIKIQEEFEHELDLTNFVAVGANDQMMNGR